MTEHRKVRSGPRCILLSPKASCCNCPLLPHLVADLVGVCIAMMFKVQCLVYFRGFFWLAHSHPRVSSIIKVAKDARTCNTSASINRFGLSEGNADPLRYFLSHAAYFFLLTVNILKHYYYILLTSSHFAFDSEMVYRK